MKGLKKLLTGILAATLALTMNVTAFAAENNTNATTTSIEVEGAKTGETYNVYKLLDYSTVTNSKGEVGNTYTINSKWEGFWNGVGSEYITKNTVGSSTYVVWAEGKDTAVEMEAFGKKAAKYAEDNKVQPEKKAVEAKNNSATFEGLDYGYYMVTSTLGTAVSIATRPGEGEKYTIKEKNQGNTTEKKVKEDSTGEYVDKNDAQIGDKVEFRSKVTIAKNSINVKYHDTMTSGLSWTGIDDVNVYTDEDCTDEVSTDYYSVAAGTIPETFVVSFTDTYVAGFSAATTTLYIKYNAVLNENAVVTKAENNTPTITWGNSGKSDGNPTDTTTHFFKILKYDGAKGTNSPLAGAKFILWSTKTTTDGKVEKDQQLKLAVKKDNNLLYKVYYDAVPDGYEAATDNKIETVATDKITVEGVDSDKYLLEETDAPLGFTKLAAPVEIKVNADNSFVAEVPNLSGIVLPSTGGIGTTIFYILGGILIVAGVAYFMVRRKVNAE